VADPTTAQRPKQLLSRANRDLARNGIWSWTIPALAARLPDGTTFRTCRAAGICSQVCFARSGTYNFPAVKAAHVRNLLFTLEDPDGWEQAMTAELSHPKFVGAHVRVHAAGDFYSDAYARAWLRIIRATPHTSFYAYTKEVMIHDRILEPERLPNAVWIISLGGIYDRYVDLRRHRVCDVFPTEAGIETSGWHSQAASDLLAAYGPAPVAMAANRIPHLQRRQGNRRFSEWQREVDRARGDDAVRLRRRRRAAIAYSADAKDER
jgi:hypothetical protein